MLESHNRNFSRKGKARNQCTDRVKSMDLFGENFVMKLDEGRVKHYSFMGVLLSFIFLATLSVFTYSKSLAWQ